MRLTFLTPLGVTLALAALVPLAALLLVRGRARRLRRALGVAEPRRWGLVLALATLAALALTVGMAAAQPVVEWSETHRVRTDAEVFVVLDVSRSMLAQSDLDAPRRLDRAKAAALRLRRALVGVRVGLASLTDRVLPHLFPSPDEDVFAATLERSMGIEQPPPRSAFLSNATNLNALAAIRGQRFFSPTSQRRLVIVLTDAESAPVANARLGALYRRDPAIQAVFVQFWGEDERVYTRGVPEPQYRPDPSARALLEGLAASTGGSVYGEHELALAERTAKKLLGEGPTVVQGRRGSRVELAPYLAAFALLPVGLLLWRRDR